MTLHFMRVVFFFIVSSQMITRFRILGKLCKYCFWKDLTQYIFLIMYTNMNYNNAKGISYENSNKTIYSRNDNSISRNQFPHSR